MSNPLAESLQLSLIVGYTACRLLVIFLRFYMADDTDKMRRQSKPGLKNSFAILPPVEGAQPG
jgi:hypothetical protein